MEVRLEDGLQHELQSHLHQAVFERGNAQRTHFARQPRLGDEPLPDRFGAVGAATELLSDNLEELRRAAGPLTGAEVPARPASTGSAHVRLAGSTRSASPVSLSPRTALHGVRGSPPREVTDSFVMNNSPFSSTT